MLIFLFHQSPETLTGPDGHPINESMITVDTDDMTYDVSIDGETTTEHSIEINTSVEDFISKYEKLGYLVE